MPGTRWPPAAVAGPLAAVALLAALAGCTGARAPSGAASPAAAPRSTGPAAGSPPPGTGLPPGSPPPGTGLPPGSPPPGTGLPPGSPPPSGGSPGPVPPSRRPCRQPPLYGVHNPSRLTVKRACVSVTGVVAEVHQHNPDGDYTFNLRLDPAYAALEDSANRREGGLHVEIVPADQPGCVAGRPVFVRGVTGLGTCTGADVALPRVGEHVRVVGTYVLDRDNRWFEIHPAWLVAALPG